MSNNVEREMTNDDFEIMIIGHDVLYCFDTPEGRKCIGPGVFDESIADFAMTPEAKQKFEEIRKTTGAHPLPKGIAKKAECPAGCSVTCADGICQCTPAATTRAPHHSTVSEKRVSQKRVEEPVRTGPTTRQLIERVQAGIVKLAAAVHEKLARDQRREHLNAELRRVQKAVAEAKKIATRETLAQQMERIRGENQALKDDRKKRRAFTD